MSDYDRRENSRRLGQARSALEDFDTGASRSQLLARLEATDPRHPWVLVARWARVLATVMAAGAVVTLFVPLLLAQLPEPIVLPGTTAHVLIATVLGVVAIALAGLWSVSRNLAARWARFNSPLLPSESWERDRLVADRNLASRRKRRERSAAHEAAYPPDDPKD